MRTVTIDILEGTDESLVLNILNDLSNKNLIRFQRFESVVLPGSPMTINELDLMLDVAERGPFLSIEELQARLSL